VTDRIPDDLTGRTCGLALGSVTGLEAVEDGASSPTVAPRRQSITSMRIRGSAIMQDHPTMVTQR
jgi:hypothetical protein